MDLTLPASFAVWGAAGLILYAYVGYPVLLRLLGLLRPHRGPAPTMHQEWPTISISVPVYNEEVQIRGLIERLLELDYPADRRQIVIVSDASTDATDRMVAEYHDRGVELVRVPERRGKTAAENFAHDQLRGEIVINTDASVRIQRDALRPLVARFADPTVGVASGRDLSMSPQRGDANAGESGYVGYEMAVRQLETRVGGIVGASGCFYAIRSHLHRAPLPAALSRDFAAALIAREHGYRAVSVDEAICLVPRTDSLQHEYRRKVRTITRGIETLWFKRHLLSPLRYPLFAWMLFSHKICRWLVPWALALAFVGLLLLGITETWARWAAGLALLGGLLGGLGWALSSRGPLPRWLALPAYGLSGNLAALHAGLRALHGDQNATWEPTRRPVVVTR